MMRRLLIACVAVLLIVPQVHATEESDPYTHFFNDTWNAFDEELELAREEGKRGVFMFFEMDACPFCHWMKQEVLSRSDVQEYFRENFLNFPVDIEGALEVTTFDGKLMSQRDYAVLEHRVRATPVMLFFDLEGEVVHRYTGRTSGAAEFIQLGEYVASGAHEEMSFPAYQRQQRDAGEGSSDGPGYF